MNRYLVTLACLGLLSGCATLTEDAMTPIAISFSDGTSGQCKLSNKRGAWLAMAPSTVSVRKSDDPLQYDCFSEDGRQAFGSIPSEMGGKIIASAVFLDFGITDAITDKHRRYAASYVIPLPKNAPRSTTSAPETTKASSEGHSTAQPPQANPKSDWMQWKGPPKGSD